MVTSLNRLGLPVHTSRSAAVAPPRVHTAATPPPSPERATGAGASARTRRCPSRKKEWPSRAPRPAALASQAPRPRRGPRRSGCPGGRLLTRTTSSLVPDDPLCFSVRKKKSLRVQLQSQAPVRRAEDALAARSLRPVPRWRPRQRSQFTGHCSQQQCPSTSRTPTCLKGTGRRGRRSPAPSLSQCHSIHTPFLPRARSLNPTASA